MVQLSLALWMLVVMVGRATLRRRFPGARVADILPFTARLRVGTLPRRHWKSGTTSDEEDELAAYLRALRKWSITAIGIPGMVLQFYLLVRFVL